MIFPKPVPFREAIEARAVKALLPTTASSLELARLPAEILERSLFSARTASAEHLSVIGGIVDRALNPEQVRDAASGLLRPRQAGEYMNEAEARQLIRASLRRIGYDPASINAVPGSLKDLGSEKRIRLIFEMNVGMARGYGQWKQGQTAAVLDQWPAQEFLRVEARNKERVDWPARFVAAGGTITAGGRMVALKNTPVWTNLSRFGLPYPPFDYSSGMGVMDIDRDEAMSLNLIDRDTRIAPEDRGFNTGLQAKDPAGKANDTQLRRAIMQGMGGAVRFDDGVMSLAESVPSVTQQRKNRAVTAVETMLAQKRSVYNAIVRDDIGAIDLRWVEGTRRTGGALHVMEERALKDHMDPRDALLKLPDILADGRATKKQVQKGKNGIHSTRQWIQLGNWTAVVSLDYFGKPRPWVVTAWRNKK